MAAAPVRYSNSSEGRVGAFSPTGIVKFGQYFYALFVYSDASRTGICLMRTVSLNEPQSWRAYDGQNFNVRFINPYRTETVEPRTCSPLDRLIPNTIGALVRHEPSQTFIIIQTTPGSNKRPGGVYYSTSNDLLRWTEPRLLIAAPIFNDFDCSYDKFSFGYGSILDPESSSPSFETIAHSPYLYLTRFNLEGCRRGKTRDLIRIRLVVEP